AIRPILRAAIAFRPRNISLHAESRQRNSRAELGRLSACRLIFRGRKAIAARSIGRIAMRSRKPRPYARSRMRVFVGETDAIRRAISTAIAGLDIGRANAKSSITPKLRAGR